MHKSVLLRVVVVVLFVLAATAQVTRTAGVAAFAEGLPHSAAAFWPSHPDVLRSEAMAEVGDAAGRGRLPSHETLDRFEEFARAAPLAPEPFLVHAAIAQREGDYGRAERLLLHARERHPRSAAARFLLADLYLRTGRTVLGLNELPVLSRLVPGGMGQLAPALAAYAGTPGAVLQLRRIVARYPEIEAALLHELSADPRNVELILKIVGSSVPADGASRWQERLVSGLVEQGDYARAHSVWARLSGLSPEGTRGLFNPGFEQRNAPPPFNWSLASGAGGVAEPHDGGLRVLYFGRENLVLANQLLLLSSGRYGFAMNVAVPAGEESEIAWTVTCLPSGQQVLQLPVRTSGGATSLSAEFEVPSERCGAQRLELKGVGEEFPQTADFRITGLSLAPVGG